MSKEVNTDNPGRQGGICLATKLRLVFLVLALVPQAMIYSMTYQSALVADKTFGQAEAASLASALLLVLGLPGLVTEWMVGRHLDTIRDFCSRLKLGFYSERLALPNEARDGDGEDPLIMLKRDMNWMARQIDNREKELRKAIDDLQKSRCQIDEQNRFLAKANAELITTQEKLKEQSVELASAFRDMQAMALTDPLTAIANRRCFFEALDRCFAPQECSCRPISMLIFDVDRFKSINDQYGHQVGDRVLLELAKIIQGHIRNEDLAARIGGEEYAVLLPGACSHEAGRVACRIHTAVANYDFRLDGSRRVPVTTSIGICTLTRLPCFDKEKLYNYADQALYYSKNSGRNCIAAYDPDTRSVNRIKCA